MGNTNKVLFKTIAFMTKALKTFCYLFTTILALLIALLIFSPCINDNAAQKVCQELINIPLPPSTQLVVSSSAAGNLCGNGDKMMLFGAILLESQLTEEELNTYYQTRSQGQHFFVTQQQQPEISVITNQACSFSAFENATDAANYYMVYAWGENKNPLWFFDFRSE